MGLRDQGYSIFGDDVELQILMIIEGDSSDRINGMTVETLYEPTEYEIKRVCVRHGLPPTDILELIRGRAPGTHSMMIDVKKYLEGQEK